MKSTKMRIKQAEADLAEANREKDEASVNKEMETTYLKVKPFPSTGNPEEGQRVNKGRNSLRKDCERKNWRRKRKL